MSIRPSRLVLLGHPVHHSLSPLFQNAALRSCRVPLTYEAIDVPPQALEGTLHRLVEERAAGNVTIPHKETVAALCSRRTLLAERVGAVNTFWVEQDGALVGDNTDVGGFTHLVRQVYGEVQPGLRLALLGAGGAAAAVLAAVEQWPACEVTLYNRSAPRLERLAARFPIVKQVTQDAAAAVRGCQLVVNATAIGLDDETLPVALDALEPNATVADLVYRPGETAWVRGARTRGLQATDGLPMLLEQGALAFERWLGVPAPREAMWQAVRQRDVKRFAAEAE